MALSSHHFNPVILIPFSSSSDHPPFVNFERPPEERLGLGRTFRLDCVSAESIRGNSHANTLDPILGDAFRMI